MATRSRGAKTMPPEPVAGLRAVQMEAATDGLVLTLDIEHLYENGSTEPIEAVYTFPVPFDAVVLRVEADHDGQTLPVVEQETRTAEDAYEAVHAERGFGALVERTAPGFCIASLGALRPGSRARLRVRLGRFLEVAGGYARIVAPSLATMPEGSRRGSDAGHLGPPSSSLLAEYPLTFRLTLHGRAALAQAFSPTHVLKRTRSGEEVILDLAAPAMLDRDVVVTLTGLPAQDGEWIAHEGVGLAVAATTPPIADERRSMDAIVVIDAAGPLGPMARDMSKFLKLLASEWEPGDRLSATRIGRTLSPNAPATVGPGGLDMAILGLGAAGLGDIPPGASPPPLNLPSGADLCLVTDGRTRVAEWVAEWAAAEGRRLFVLGVGSVPDAGWLHPAALATGGDYIGLSPSEAPEPAAHRLLGALTLPPLRRPAALWGGGAPLWSDEPAVWRSDLRGVACAAFEDDMPETFTLAFERDRPVMHLARSAGREAFADATARVAAARRLSTLEGDGLAKWARRFALPIVDAAWMAQAPSQETDDAREARLMTTPQMVAAGWRGVGRLTPVPALVESSLPPPPEPRLVGGRKPSRLWIAAATVVVVAAAGLGVWGGWRSPPAPAVTPLERLPILATNTRSPIREADATIPPPDSPGVASGARLLARPAVAAVARIVVLVAAGGALTIWLRGRRRRRAKRQSS